MKIKMFKTNDVKVPHPELFNLVKPNTYERKKNLQLQQHSSHKLLNRDTLHSSQFFTRGIGTGQDFGWAT